MSIWPIIDAPGRRIGYARVSTKDQKLRMQRDALENVSCDLVFEDHGVSGTKASRNGLDAMLDELKAGDIYHLDTMKALAEQIVDEGLFGDIPEQLTYYIDLDAIARDLSIDYTETEIAGQRLIYRCA